MHISKTPLKLVTIYVMLWLKTFNTYIYLWLVATLKVAYYSTFKRSDIITISITKNFLPTLFELFNLFWVQINPLN
jgi:hypothetical protein